MNLLLIVILAPLLVASRPNHERAIFQCERPGFQCLDEIRFTFCSNIARFVNLGFYISICPEGYLCQEGLTYPCVIDPVYITTQTTLDESDDISLTPTIPIEEPVSEKSEEDTDNESTTTTLLETTTVPVTVCGTYPPDWPYEKCGPL